jgi:3-hydroxyisobutyrate dehydrogenase
VISAKTGWISRIFREEKTMSIKAGFIGLGFMGKPMARWMVEKGLETAVCDIADPPVAELVEKGAKRAANPRELADQCDVVGVCVRDDDDVRQVLFGENGFFESSNKGLVIAIHSTVYTETVMEAGAAAEKRGMHVLDACVTGGPMAAEAGTMTYMVGGTKDAFEKYRPVFETSAKTIVYTGELGTATYTKICNNLLQYVAFTGVIEAFTLLKHLGVRKEALEEVTRSNGLLNESNATYMNGVVQMDDETMRSDGMQDYMRGRLAIAEKDLSIALKEAQRVGYAMPGTALVSQIMARVYRVDDPKRR